MYTNYRGWRTLAEKRDLYRNAIKYGIIEGALATTITVSVIIFSIAVYVVEF